MKHTINLICVARNSLYHDISNFLNFAFFLDGNLIHMLHLLHENVRVSVTYLGKYLQICFLCFSTPGEKIACIKTNLIKYLY